jgi:hypothetical protein
MLDLFSCLFNSVRYYQIFLKFFFLFLCISAGDGHGSVCEPNQTEPIGSVHNFLSRPRFRFGSVSRKHEPSPSKNSFSMHFSAYFKFQLGSVRFGRFGSRISEKVVGSVYFSKNSNRTHLWFLLIFRLFFIF